MTSINPSHPIRTILKEAALGRLPTRAQLDLALKDRPDQPDTVDLNRLRRDVLAAAEEVAVIARPAPGSHHTGDARKRCDQHWERFVGQMSDTELAVGPNLDDGIDYDALARGNY